MTALRLPRRRLLQAGLSLALFGDAAEARPLAAPRFSQNPFTLGVAAGDPAPDGFVIWTRLAPEPQAPDGGLPPADVEVRWEVAEDPGFQRVVRAGAARADADLAHSVHVEVFGLRPGRPYWYRFLVAGAGASPVGLARTTPAPGERPSQVRIAVAGCQNYEMGYYSAYRHLARESDLDAVFHYGDYIYEMGPRTGYRVRPHLTGELYSLVDYRRRYAQYKADPDLQAAHAAAAFVVSFDDHEIDDNWAGGFDKDGSPAEVFAARKAAALQAWYEHMPVRRAQRPVAGRVRAYRRLDYGGLLRMHVLDTRAFRSDQVCERPGAEIEEIRACDVVDRPDRTMLGADQEAWLDRGLAGGAAWNLLAQQVLMMPYDGRRDGETTPMRGKDNWNGYPLARQRLMDSIGRRGLTNVVVSSGDAHQHFVGALPRRVDDLTGPALATEFLTTSITSGGTGGVRHPFEQEALTHNPNVQLLNNQRGYQVFTISPELWRTDLKVMDQVDTTDGQASTLASFVVDPRMPGAQTA